MRINYLLGILAILFTQQNSWGQMTICEDNTILYFACYKLNADNSFTYQYIDGSSEKIGIGTYEKTKKTITFTYDDLVSPVINKSKRDNKPQQVDIYCSYILDSFPRLFTPVIYDNTLYFCDSSGHVRINNYTSGKILIHNYVDSISVNPQQDDANYYNIYTHSPNAEFVPKGTVQQLERKGKRYREKIPSYFDKKGNPLPEGSAWRYVYFKLNE